MVIASKIATCTSLVENLKSCTTLPYKSRFIHLIDSITTFRLTPTHSYQFIRKLSTHKMSRCKHVQQCHIWGDKTRAAYMIVWICIDKRNHL